MPVSTILRCLTRVLVMTGVLVAATVVPGAAAPVFVPGGYEPAPRTLSPQFFRLEPGVVDSTYRLLVIPVRFPEDATLGSGDREGLKQKLSGGPGLTLAGFYTAATGSRIRIAPTLAPTILANHSRTHYTNEGPGFGFGLDPADYPNNAQGLVEEVTAKLEFLVDFKKFDNTHDGLVDGLLLLHSGPAAPEAGEEVLTDDHLLAHAFTVSAPMPRGSVSIFPYAIASTRDDIGPWAHEVGHLFGLPDLYVANGFCPGPGVGEWSLMATGANRSAGQDPSGLDPYSRQLLGIPPRFDIGTWVDLAGGDFIRAFRPGEEQGPRYFLIERRTGSDGLGLPQPATVVYYVDEDAGDNRSCPFPPEQYRPLVEVRGVLCPDTSGCVSVVLDDTSVPPLTDGDGNPSFLRLELNGSAVRVSHTRLSGASIEHIQMRPPEPGPPEEQQLLITLRNLDLENPTQVDLDVLPHTADSVTVTRIGSGNPINLTPGETRIDSSFVLVPVSGEVLAKETVELIFSVTRSGTGFSTIDTLWIPVNQMGLDSGRDAEFTTANLNPSRLLPWMLSENGWRAEDLDVLAHGEVATPWFLMPPDSRLTLNHSWELDALSPDVALDAGRVLLRRPLNSDHAVTPNSGWGFTAERKIGNALAGQEVLSGLGDRFQILDLSSYAGDVVQVVFRAAGDFSSVPGNWTLRDVAVHPAPGISFLLEQKPGPTLQATTGSPPVAGLQFFLYEGVESLNPAVQLNGGLWDGNPILPLGAPTLDSGIYELVWRLPDGRADVVTAIFNFPVAPNARFLLNPFPNPVRRGASQTWQLILADGVPPGEYLVSLVDGGGRLVSATPVVVETTGTRQLVWNGTDQTGRQVPSGMYFLQVRRPDGRRESRKIVVIP